MKKKSAYDFQKESKIFAVVMLIILVLIMTAGVLSVCGVFDSNIPEWRPDGIYPMANANISWEQSFHSGPWGADSSGN